MRTYVITGGVSGIGKATADLVKADGHKVITVDIKGADVNADLSTEEGVAHMVAEVTKLSGGAIDVIVANAGLSSNTTTSFAVNYYGAIGTLEGLRPLLEKSPAPRAVATASVASLHPHNAELVESALNGTREATMRISEAHASPDGYVNYPSSKAALAKWIRRECIKPQWAGKGIALNAIGPGIIKTPMTKDLLATQESRDYVNKSVPMPLNGAADPIVCAHTIKFLTSVENTHVTGQCVFVDGGCDATFRGMSTW